MMYRQITFAERYALGLLRRDGLSPAAIARTLGRHRSTILREVQRNQARSDGTYRPQLADWYACGRRSHSRRNRQFSSADLERIRVLLAQRARAYAQADLTIDTSRLSVEEAAERVWAQLGPRLCRSWQYLLDHSGQLARRYAGRYIVVAEDRILGSGGTHLEAYRNASPRLTEQRETGIYYIPLPEESLTAL